MLPGRKFSISTWHLPANCRANSCPLGTRRSMVRLFLPRLTLMKYALSPR